MRRAGFLLDLLLKTGLAALLILVLVRPELAELSDRGLAGRIVLATAALTAVPLGWWLTGPHHAGAYPYGVDTLLSAPFVLELSGRLAGLSGGTRYWGFAGHLANWVFLVLTVGLILRNLVGHRLLLVSLCVGVGATTAILWELAEYAVGLHELHDTIYKETLSDLGSALVGS